MVKEHKLIIISLFDAQARCNCGGWGYCFTGERTRKQIQAEYKKHIKGV